MKILVVNYEFPPIGGGGGRVAEDLCRTLSQRGHQIRVQTAHLKGLPKLEKRDGYEIYRSFSFRHRADRCRVPEMAAFLVTNLVPTLRHAVAWKPDVMHVHFAVPTGVLGLLVSRLTDVPYVLTAHLGDVPGALPDQTDRLFRWVKPLTFPIWRHAAAVTAVSEHLRQLALRSYSVNVTTIPNGMDLSQCQPSPPTPHEPKRLMFAGRFDPQKNVLFLVDLLKQVADLDWQMEMLGDGSLMADVRARIAQIGLTDRIHLDGWVKPNAVEQVMSQSDILLLPSVSEGMPVVGVRALGHGLAILGSDIGGIADVVQHGQNGFLCPVNDMEAFESALRLMLTTNGHLQEMKQASRAMAEQFDLQQIAQKYEQVFEAVRR